jgi:K+-transporting ATPase KdpF subunit
LPVPVCLLGLHQGLRQALGEITLGKIMDYIIAGITSLGLFVYLLYALLRPEKF